MNSDIVYPHLVPTPGSWVVQAVSNKDVENALSDSLLVSPGEYRWSTACTDILSQKPSVIYAFDQLQHYMKLVNGEFLNINVVLNPLFMLCLSDSCRQANPIIKLRHLNSLGNYISHLETHKDCLWSKSMLARLKNSYLSSNKASLEKLGADPITHIKISIRNHGFSHPSAIANLRIFRDIPIGHHFSTVWINLLLKSDILNEEHAIYQSLMALIDSFVNFPHSISSWDKYKTEKLFGVALSCTLSKHEYNNLRGISYHDMKDGLKKKKTVATIAEFKKDIANINTFLPSFNVTQAGHMRPCFHNQQIHVAYLKAHYQLLKKNKNSIFIETSTFKKYIVTCLIDEQGIAQNTFEHVS